MAAGVLTYCGRATASSEALDWTYMATDLCLLLPLGTDVVVHGMAVEAAVSNLLPDPYIK